MYLPNWMLKGCAVGRVTSGNNVLPKGQHGVPLDTGYDVFRIWET